MKLFTYADAILRLVPNTGFQIHGEDLSTLNWESDPDLRPTDEAIEESLIQLNAEYDALAWKRSRQEEYPSIQECVHAILDDDLDALQAKRAETKLKYPKGG